MTEMSWRRKVSIQDGQTFGASCLLALVISISKAATARCRFDETWVRIWHPSSKSSETIKLLCNSKKSLSWMLRLNGLQAAGYQKRPEMFSAYASCFKKFQLQAMDMQLPCNCLGASSKFFRGKAIDKNGLNSNTEPPQRPNPQLTTRWVMEKCVCAINLTQYQHPRRFSMVMDVCLGAATLKLRAVQHLSAEHEVLCIVELLIPLQEVRVRFGLKKLGQGTSQV